MGPAFRVHAAHRKLVVLAGVEANSFASKEGREALISKKAWGKLTGHLHAPHAIVALDGPDHLKLRTYLRNAVSKQPVEEHSEDVSAIVTDMLRDVPVGSEISVRDYTRNLTNWQVNFLVAGQRQQAPKDLREAHYEYFRYLTNTLSLGKWPKLALYLPRHRRNARVVEAHARELLDGASRTGGADSWMRLIVEGQKKYPHLFTPGDMFTSAILPAFAGVDTFGATGTFAIRELLRNRPVRERLVAEVDAAYEAAGGKLPDPEVLRGMPALNGFCMEILRLYPVAFGMPRHAGRDFEFEGYQVFEGEEVLLFTTSTHTDPRYFPRPYQVDLDRYGPERAEHKQKFAYSPYGRGPHACLGAAMADLMFLITIATLVRHVDFEDAYPHRQYKMVFDPSTTLDFDFVVRFRGFRHPPAA